MIVRHDGSPIKYVGVNRDGVRAKAPHYGVPDSPSVYGNATVCLNKSKGRRQTVTLTQSILRHEP